MSATVARASAGQERMWLGTQLGGDEPLHNQALRFRLSGDVDVAALAAALDRVANRHAALRTTFEMIKGRLAQIVHDTAAVELRVLEPSRRDLDRVCTEETERPFALDSGPLLRAALVRVDRDDHLLLLTVHHIVVDAWSLDCLLTELSTAYEDIRAGRKPDVECPHVAPWTIADRESQYLGSQEFRTDLAYWRNLLADAPAVVTFPADRPRPASGVMRGARVARPVPPALAQSLRAFTLEHRTSTFMTLLAAFKALLARYASTKDVVAGTLVSTRDHFEAQGAMGFFVNTVALRTEVDGSLSFRELARRVRAGALDAYEHQAAPFDRVVQEVAPERRSGQAPLVQLLFVHHGEERPLRLQGLTVEALPIEAPTVEFDMVWIVRQREADLSLTVEYASGLFDETTVERTVDDFFALLGRVLEQPDAALSTVPLAMPAGPRGASVRGEGVAAVIASQASCTPDATALIFHERKLTYAALEEASGRLAARLTAAGLRRGDLAGVCVRRSPELVVALLAILRVGAAYVPMDPDYPPDRLAFMLRDSEAALVVTSADRVDAFGAEPTPVVAVDDGTPDAQVPPAQLCAHDLAYVTYTSGSTGTPKGVGVTHGNVLSFFAAMDAELKLDEPVVWLGLTSVSFDISVLELLWTIARGHAVVIAGEIAEAFDLASRHAA